MDSDAGAEPLHRIPLLRRGSSAVALRYNMWVMPVKTFLQLNLDDYGGKIPHHQKLKSQGILVDYHRVRDGPVGFISHQWLGWTDADPDFQQLHTLRRFFERILTGDITKVTIDMITEFTTKGRGMKLSRKELLHWAQEGYIWYDYWSVPQALDYDLDASEELMNAVESIPAYIEESIHFVVLCPPCYHKDNSDSYGAQVNDFGSWIGRGWCRAEAMARLLARRTGPMIRLQSAEGTPELVPSWQAWKMQPGMGSFTCCSRNHLFEQTDKMTGETVMVNVPCDKKRVGKLVHVLVDSYELTAKKQLRCAKGKDRGDKLIDLRWILMARHHMLRGIEAEEELTSAQDQNKGDAAQVLRDFLDLFEFPLEEKFVNGTKEDHASGLTPLFYAVACGKMAVAKELVQRGANVSAALRQTDPERYLFKGQTLLHLAAFWGTGDMVSLLLDNGADPMARDSVNGQTAAHIACGASNTAALAVLLGREPRLMEERAFGYTPVAVAAHFDIRDGCKCGMELLRRGACADQETVNGLGHNLLHLAAMKVGGDLTMMDAMLTAGTIDVNAGIQKRHRSGLVRTIKGVCHATDWFNRYCCFGLRENSSMVNFFTSLSVGETPLMAAARTGLVPAVRRLLAAGADPSLKDANGDTARDLASRNNNGGPFETVAAVLREAEEQWRLQHTKRGLAAAVEEGGGESVEAGGGERPRKRAAVGERRGERRGESTPAQREGPAPTAGILRASSTASPRSKKRVRVEEEDGAPRTDDERLRRRRSESDLEDKYNQLLRKYEDLEHRLMNALERKTELRHAKEEGRGPGGGMHAGALIAAAKQAELDAAPEQSLLHFVHEEVSDPGDASPTASLRSTRRRCSSSSSSGSAVSDGQDSFTVAL